MSSPADVVLVNAKVVTLDRRRPRAEALAMARGRILHAGSRVETSELIGPDTAIIDVEGGLVVPAFHDAHLHLLSYARGRSRIDCRRARSIADLQALLRYGAERSGAALLTNGAWLSASGYDELALAEGRHPDRWDLDAAVADTPVRLQHRSRHLDVFNSAGLRAIGLTERSATEASSLAQVERDPDTGMPTGRIFNGGELLQRVRPPSSIEELAPDIRAATEQLLSRGITTVQDATFTNRPDELDLFGTLVERGDLGVRVFMMRSARWWRDFDSTRPSPIRIGPIKIMLDEARSDPAEIRHIVAEARAAGQAVAFHAVSEAEVAVALDALRSAPRRASSTGGPDRIEHGAVIPDEWVEDLREVGACVVGQPALVHERGDVYLSAYPDEHHGWIHRARSLIGSGIGYAAGSDAPVTEPDVLLAMMAARNRVTAGGTILGRKEALTPMQALAAFTLGPARAVGAARDLGTLRPGAIADVAVLDPRALEDAAEERPERTARITFKDGRMVWRRDP